MIAVDTNVLVYAHRAEAPQHAPALSWISYLAEGSGSWGIPMSCLTEFVRVVTHRKVFTRPSTLEETIAWLKILLASPSVRILCPSAAFAGHFFAELQHSEACGNLVFDAQIAAVCREHGVSRLLTQDRDFTRFRGLTLLDVRKPPPD